MNLKQENEEINPSRIKCSGNYREDGNTIGSVCIKKGRGKMIATAILKETQFN